MAESTGVRNRKEKRVPEGLQKLTRQGSGSIGGEEPGSPQAERDLSCNRGWVDWVNGLFESIPPSNAVAESKVTVDLAHGSNEELRERAAQLEAALKRREEAAQTDEAQEKLRKQLEHVERQLDADKVFQLSMQHLEIYVSFLRRIFPLGANAEKARELERRLNMMLAKHPQRNMPRSGDHEGSQARPALLDVPIGRRRQTAAIFLLNFFTGPLLVLFFIILFGWFLPVATATFFALYAAWVIYDNVISPRPWAGPGARLVPAYRDSPLFRHFADYFPLRIAVERQDLLKPTGRYLMCLHPHGVQCSSVFGLISYACGARELLPGLKLTAQTLPMNFWFPVMREHCIACGVGNASKKSILQALTWTPGAATVLVVGGAKEALHAAPHTNKIALKNRMGFVKIALQTGASLVPCYSFGENSLYENLTKDKPRLMAWQRRVQKLLTFAPLLVAGRGVFSYSGGLLPNRRPLTVVVGEPIEVEKAENPTPEQIQQLHSKYIDALEALFELYRDVYDPICDDMSLV